MRKLEYSIRGILWTMWLGFYVVIAAWVGEGLWGNNETRAMAVFVGLVWSFIGALPIELLELPQNITKVLLEDDDCP